MVIRALIVDDEKPARDELAYLLGQHSDIEVAEAYGADEALAAIAVSRPDLVLLDIHLPKVDGVDVLKMIRSDGDVPVIMVTALADDVDKLLALRMGADDYVVKPFTPPEVVARVRAVLRRTQAKPAPVAAPTRVGPIEIDVEAHSAAVYDDQGNPVSLSLTLTEFRLLACLAAQPRRCFSRSYLIENCLPESDALERVIDSHLSKLRRKLQLAGQDGLIETVRGIGYRLWPWD